MKLLLLLPVLVQAQITIDIHASRTSFESSINTSGYSENIISDADLKTFNITQENLNAAIFNITKRVPTNVYVKGPTPWNNLYKIYKWRPVTVVVKPFKAKILDIKTDSVLLNKRQAVNDENEVKTERITLTGKVENKLSTNWKQTDNFTANINYTINFDGLGNFTKFQLNSLLGEKLSKNKVASISKWLVEVALSPKTDAVVILTATKVNVKFEVEYLAILDGHVATNNEVKYLGHHFWAYDIATVMKAANMSEIRNVTEVIAVEFYTDAKTTLL